MFNFSNLDIALIQINATSNQDLNIDKAYQYLKLASQSKSNNNLLCMFPEMFHYYGDTLEKKQKSANDFEKLTKYFANLAKEFNIYLHCGSLYERASEKKFYNTTLVFDTNGKIIAKYRKIKLFNFDSSSKLSFKESEYIEAGKDYVIYKIGEFVIGCTICFDLRFPHIFSKLRSLGANIIAVPSAFTYETGKAHWEILLRARAIENQLYILGCNQTGWHSEERRSYGHSMIISPWGEIIDKRYENEDIVKASLNKSYIDKVRKAMLIDNL